MNNWSSVLDTLLSSLFVLFCLIISFIDLYCYRIPNKVLLASFPLFLLLKLLAHPDLMSHSLYGGLAGILLLLPPALLLPKSVGMGDVKLLTVLGSVIGWKELMHALLYASFFAFLTVLSLLVLKKIKHSDAIPFAPFLCGAVLFIHFTAN